MSGMNDNVDSVVVERRESAEHRATSSSGVPTVAKTSARLRRTPRQAGRRPPRSGTVGDRTKLICRKVRQHNNGKERGNAQNRQNKTNRPIGRKGVTMSDDREQWAIVELMGHAQTAGLIRTSDLGGLLRLDVPMEDGFRTEYYGEAAIYAIRIVSEEIARAFARPDRDICAYDTPIVPRAEFEEALAKSREAINKLTRDNECLRQRLTAVPDLPAALPEASQE